MYERIVWIKYYNFKHLFKKIYVEIVIYEKLSVIKVFFSQTRLTFCKQIWRSWGLNVKVYTTIKMDLMFIYYSKIYRYIKNTFLKKSYTKKTIIFKEICEI